MAISAPTRPRERCVDCMRWQGCRVCIKKAHPADAGWALICVFWDSLSLRSASLNIGRLLAFRTLGHFERNLLSLLEGLEAAHLNRRKVREQIFTAVIRRNKAVTFRVVEPFH